MTNRDRLAKRRQFVLDVFEPEQETEQVEKVEQKTPVKKPGRPRKE